jgi:hypothetical protein
MPALPVIADVFRCAWNWRTSGGQTATNVIHINCASAANDPVPVMELFDDWVGGNMFEATGDAAQVFDVAITPLDGSSATQHFAPATPANWTGLITGDFSPASCALIHLGTSLRGRSHRGRIFLPFVGETAMSNGSLTSPHPGDITTAWQTFQSNLASDPQNPADLVVASYKLASDRIVGTIVCESVLATQRRRQGRLRSA